MVRSDDGARETEASRRNATPASVTRRPSRAAFLRAAGFFIFWTILIGFDLGPADAVVGLIAAAAATWTSLRLLPPGSHRPTLGALPSVALRFLWQSVVGGVDVARRAFAPRMALHPGLVLYATRYPRGPVRNTFASLTSLLPGSVSVDDDEQGLLYHCLDDTQPIAAQLAAEEAALARALPGPLEQ